MYFSRICVNYTSSTKIRVRDYDVMFYIFLTVKEELFFYVRPLRL